MLGPESGLVCATAPGGHRGSADCSDSVGDGTHVNTCRHLCSSWSNPSEWIVYVHVCQLQKCFFSMCGCTWQNRFWIPLRHLIRRLPWQLRSMQRLFLWKYTLHPHLESHTRHPLAAPARSDLLSFLLWPDTVVQRPLFVHRPYLWWNTWGQCLLSHSGHLRLWPHASASDRMRHPSTCCHERYSNVAPARGVSDTASVTEYVAPLGAHLHSAGRNRFCSLTRCSKGRRSFLEASLARVSWFAKVCGLHEPLTHSTLDTTASIVGVMRCVFWTWRTPSGEAPCWRRTAGERLPEKHPRLTITWQRPLLSYRDMNSQCQLHEYTHRTRIFNKRPRTSASKARAHTTAPNTTKRDVAFCSVVASCAGQFCLHCSGQEHALRGFMMHVLTFIDGPMQDVLFACSASPSTGVGLFGVLDGLGVLLCVVNDSFRIAVSSCLHPQIDGYAHQKHPSLKRLVVCRRATSPSGVSYVQLLCFVGTTSPSASRCHGLLAWWSTGTISHTASAVLNWTWAFTTNCKGLLYLWEFHV